MSIYEKTTRALMLDFVNATNLKPGQIFHKRDAINWFQRNYPKIKAHTVGLHVEGMAVNTPGHRKHHRHIKPGGGWDHFFKLGPDQFRLWDPKNDPAPVYHQNIANEASDLSESDDVIPDVSESDEVSEPLQGSREFAFERDLRNYLSRNLHVIEDNLRLYEDEDGAFDGIEYPVGGRFIDILAVDSNGDFVVLELKVSRGYDRVIGQLLRYMGWIKKHLANGKDVRGIIVASEITDDLKLACSLVGGIGLWQYELEFRLRPVQ